MFLKLLNYCSCSPFNNGFQFQTMKLTQGRALKTDLCILTGSETISPYAEYWTENRNGDNGIVMTENNVLKLCAPTIKTPSLRFCDNASNQELKKAENLITQTTINGQTVKIIKNGAYPQSVVDKKTARLLEDAFQRHIIHTTNNSYTFNTNCQDDNTVTLIKHPEYAFHDNYYIRVINQNKTNCLLSNGEKPKPNKPYWIRVEAVDWLCEPDINNNNLSRYFITQHTLLSGIPVQPNTKFSINDFLFDVMRAELLQHNLQEELIPANTAIFKSEQKHLDNEKHNLLSFKEFIRNQLLQNIDEMSRFAYFSQILKLAEQYTHVKKDTPEKTPAQNKIFQFTRNYIKECMHQEKLSAKELLLALHLEIATQQFQDKNIHLSTKQRILAGKLRPFVNNSRQYE